MTFYTKHLVELMRRAGADPSPENKELLDRAVREVLGMERADAPEVWEKVKDIMFSGNSEKDGGLKRPLPARERSEPSLACAHVSGSAR